MPTAECKATPLYLHAELLPNIRHITLYVSIPASTPAEQAHPQISLSSSRKAVTVSVSVPGTSGDVTDTLKLPARVTEGSRRVLAAGTDAPNNGRVEHGMREYSFRMQVESEDDGLSRPSQVECLDGFVPWTARDMGPRTRVRCRGCPSVFLEPSLSPSSSEVEKGRDLAGWVWKDLPSGNWAEMMDFWHCHKPDTHPSDRDTNDAEKQTDVKGYGAANQVLASEGTVLVDVATFLVAQADCRGLRKAERENTDGDSKPEPETIVCENCNALIGVEDTVSQGWRLFKTNISASKRDPDNPNGMVWETQSVETVVAAQLLELIERESARRFVVHCGQKDGLLLWVFNPDLHYSNSSPDHSIAAQQGMKVFFQSVDDVDAVLHPAQGKISSLSLEELRLPSGVFLAMTKALLSSNSMLPGSGRIFREWQVGILNRFDRAK
ncbi:HECT-type E3 ubiquitin transferase [Aspergillus candidus]|uniref:Ubiquitin-conjugating enzyme E2-binding protein n=1 Tax=Aspergillus candidus TaxID=41067 RepID=A0A2I2FCF4_ASPCN|nr:ubiquitin-conjugating enzyme E2-binding protein [Aspergillus candidus]PLB38308.1 ubiquitin-conjugating enzyme E2-binding protein [Aspergillus candidus]